MRRKIELDRLRSLHAQLVRTQDLIDKNVQDARRKGCTWEQIGEALSITRQGAQKRYSNDS